MENEIVIVSGLPRSGTSLMMQMLDRGGLAVVTDHVRSPDTDNPRGYYELEQVKRIKEDVSWLPATRGKAFKMVSQLLYELPANESYRVIFMERDLDEMILSQEKMLARLGKPAAPSQRYQTALHRAPHQAARLARRPAQHQRHVRPVPRPGRPTRGPGRGDQRVPQGPGRCGADGEVGRSVALRNRKTPSDDPGTAKVGGAG